MDLTYSVEALWPTLEDNEFPRVGGHLGLWSPVRPREQQFAPPASSPLIMKRQDQIESAFEARVARMDLVIDVRLEPTPGPDHMKTCAMHGGVNLQILNPKDFAKSCNQTWGYEIMKNATNI